MSSPHTSSGAVLVDTEGRVLPLRGTQLDVTAGAGMARALLRQRFANPHAEPLRVRYQLPLPSDAAVAGFAFTLDGEVTRGVVKPREVARRAFEDALLSGRTAALLEEDRSSLFTEEVGNIPPGAEVEVEVSLDMPLAWRPEGAWSFRFPTVVGPRYLGASGRTPDADRVTVKVADSFTVDARARLSLRIEDGLEGAPSSTSHPLRTTDGLTCFLAEDGMPLDRDLVVDWPVAAPEPGLSLLTGRPPEGHPEARRAFGLLAVVPPAQALAPVPRDLILLVDVSGSMHGEPIAQAQRVLRALVDGLDEQDTLEAIAFASAPERWQKGPLKMTAANRKKAHRWVSGLSARGATEMRTGIEEALKGLRKDGLRQVLVVTDGYIGFEGEIVGYVQESLPKMSRVHTLGVGSAVNRSLTQGLARVGVGKELIVAPGEDAEIAARRLLAVTQAPQITALELSGSAVADTAARRLPDLYAGAPARIPVALRPEGGTLTVRGHAASGVWSETVEVGPMAPGEGAAMTAAVFARERVEDLEAARHAAGADARGLDAQIEALGVGFSISTRRTSWVAIREGETVDPRAPTRSEDMPHALADGLSPTGFGLAQASAGGVPLGAAALAAPSMMRKRGGLARSSSSALGEVGRLVSGLFGGGGAKGESFADEDADFEQEEGAELLDMFALESLPDDVLASPEPGEYLSEREQVPVPRPVKPAKPMKKSKAKGASMSRVPRLRARGRLLGGGRLLLELEPTEAVRWLGEETVEVMLPGGELREARVVLERSAHPGTLEPGLVYRFVLELDGLVAEVRYTGFVVEVVQG